MCIDALVGLVVQSFAVADAGLAFAEEEPLGMPSSPPNTVRVRLEQRVQQASDRFQRGLDTLKDELLARLRSGSVGDRGAAEDLLLRLQL